VILHWVNNYDQIGNALGYSTHQKSLKKALETQGVIMSENSDVAISIVTPDRFKPIPNKYNILYTMYECTTLPDKWIEPLQGADLIIVPCEHNKRLFRKYTDKPIEVCWEGVDVERFKYVERKFPTKEPFVYLWVGASNPRKGYEHVIIAWRLFTEKHPNWNTALYMKTTQMTRDERLLEVGGNAIVDTRFLPLEKEPEDKLPTLTDIYNMANAFLLPSMGEGFGLTLAEAMSTGLPCVYTPWSGVVDFCSSKEGYPVKWHFIPITTKEITPEGGAGREAHKSRAASAYPESIVEQMERIYMEYDFALQKGKKAAERIRKYITWEKSAKSFIDIVEKYTKEKI